ncbi:MAG: adenine phosphoribosyltransferase [Balneolales bacterium]
MGNEKTGELATIIDRIRNVPDFPKKGVIYKDITPVLNDPESLQLVSKLLVVPFQGLEVNIIAGIESRGFIFGSHIATHLGAGFVPVRKFGKLPTKKITMEYELEYGKGQLEVHEDAILAGDRVVIHDDLLATGGSARAASELVKKLGGVIVGYSFIIELTYLNGRSVLESDIAVHSLIKV